MPPPHLIFSSRLRGFVCRSCISKLNAAPQQQQQLRPWLARNLRKAHGPSQAARGKQTSAKELDSKQQESGRLHPQQQEAVTPIIRYFEETPDGVRTEMPETPEGQDEEAFMDSLAAQFGFGEDEKAYMRSMRDAPPIEDDDLMKGMREASQGKIGDDEDTRGIVTQTDRLDNLITKLQSLLAADYMPHEERRTEVRRLLFDPIQGVGGINRGIKTGEAMKLGLALDRSPSLATSLPPFLDIDRKALSPELRGVSQTGGLDINLQQEDFPFAYRKHIDKLQRCLTTALLSPSPRSRDAAKIRKVTWSSYLMARSALVARPEKVPIGFWSGLWNIFSKKDSSEYVDRMANIKHLGDDLRKAGVHMDPEQNLLYTEALMVQGDTELAPQLWKSLEPYFIDSEKAKDYWKQGVNIFSQQGQIGRALKAASMVLRNTKDITDYRMLLPVIQACLFSQHKHGVQLAWALYIRLRVHLGPHMTMSDYDVVNLSFLQANQPRLALGVFTDMMLRPDIPQVRDSTAIYTEVADSKDALNTLDISEAELKMQKSSTLTWLPPEFKNKFFFGSWLKKLIGDDHLDAATKVVDFATQLGIRPDAKHVNGLIGALFRDGSGNLVSLAERMAWNMIESRLALVKVRDLDSALEGPIRTIATSAMSDAKHVTLSQNDTPPATIETFCILIQQYRRRQMRPKLLNLFDTLRMTKIRANTHFMNELLLADIHSDNNNRKYWMWKNYTALTTAAGVRPNYETFRIIYQVECQSLSQALRKDRKLERWDAKHLFSQMMKYKDSLRKEGKAPQELHNAVILAFSLAEDQAGVAIALRALQQHFRAYPDGETARTIILGLAQLGKTNESGHRSRRLQTRKASSKDKIAQVTKILAKLKQERAETMSQQGIDLEQLSEEQKLEETLIVLTSLLRHASQSTHGAEEALQRLKRTAETMGVPECDPWNVKDSVKEGVEISQM